MRAEFTHWSEELREELTRHILPFWLAFLGDGNHFAGRIDGTGTAHPEATKGGVLMARILWTFSAAYRTTEREEYRIAAQKAYQYLSRHLIDPLHGGLFWEVSADGNPRSDKKQSYAIGFAIYSLSEYVRITDDAAALHQVKQLFKTLETHAWDPARGGYTEALSRDWQPLSDMRLSEKDANTRFSMNTHLHLLEPYTNLLRVWPDAQVASCVQRLIRIHTDHLFDASTGHLNLFFDPAWQPQGRTVSFGHDIEAAWLIGEAAATLGDQATTAHAAPVTEALGYAACEGLQPDGSLAYEYNPATGRTDSERHWWVQAEAAVGFMDRFQHSGEERFLRQSVQVWSYIRTHLTDRQAGEWFWSIREDGTPNRTDDKAGFWKCPYHNSRMCMELIARIEKLNR